MDNENKGNKKKKCHPISEEKQKKKRENSFIRMQKKHRDKRLKELAAGIANKRKTFEEMGLAYNTDEDGAEDFVSIQRFSNCDVSEVLSAGLGGQLLRTAQAAQRRSIEQQQQ